MTVHTYIQSRCQSWDKEGDTRESQDTWMRGGNTYTCTCPSADPGMNLGRVGDNREIPGYFHWEEYTNKSWRLWTWMRYTTVEHGTETFY